MIEHVTIPEGVTNLAYSMAFGGCDLSSVLIYGDVDGLSGAFDYCYNLKRVIMLGSITGEDTEYPFYETPDDLTFYVTSEWTGPSETWDGHPVKVVSRNAAIVVGNMESAFCDWLPSSVLERAENDVFTAADLLAANGRRSVAECYALGVDPEDADDDFKITSFEMVDGEPVFEFSHTEDGGGVSFEPRIKKLGKAELGDLWQEVPPGGNPAFRFFKVEVELP